MNDSVDVWINTLLFKYIHSIWIFLLNILCINHNNWRKCYFIIKNMDAAVNVQERR